MRYLACIVFPVVALLPLVKADAEVDSSDAFFANHCIRCHGAAEQNAQICLDQIHLHDVDPQVWAKVYEAIANGDMPPDGEPQPSTTDIKFLLRWIVDEADGSTQPAGRRRLNRRELSAALQELTGVPIDFGAALPDDATTDGFDTGANALSDGADLTAQWLEATRRAVDSIRFLEPESDAKLQIDFREHEFTDLRKFLQKTLQREDISTKSKRLISKKGTGLFLQTQWSGDRGSSMLGLPTPTNKQAALKLVIRLRAVRPFAGMPLPMLWVKIGGHYLDYVSIDESPTTLTYTVRMEDQLIEDNAIKVMLRSVVEMPYAVEGFPNDDRSKPEDKILGGIGIYRPKFDRKKLRTPDVQPVPSIVLEWLEVDYDFKAAWPDDGEGNETFELTDSDGTAKKLLKRWIDRAWRRPSTELERQRFFDLYSELRQQEYSFDNALRAAFQAVLMGGPFRYLESPAEPTNGTAQYAFASRLSFMLSGAPPSEELLSLAEAGELHKSNVLDEQVDRFLAGPEVDRFFRPFVTQWLELEQPITQTMSHLKKQDFRFGRHLKSSMREETIQYVARVFHDNRPAKELVDSNWTMMNDVLAWYYHREPIEGGMFRKVRLDSADNASRAGGILGHAGIQSMLCWMGDNWSIYRGAWLLNRVLDDPLPPPPLEVPELLPSDKSNRGKTVRELLHQHQQDPNCAICHRKMDPLGFAFQNFDLSGRWRDVEFEQYHRYELDGKIEWRGEGKSRLVDATGQLPRGEKFASYAEFRKIVAREYIDDIVRGLLKKLTLYGTGRQPTVRDLIAIQAIMDETSEDGYPMKDLLKAWVRSSVFCEVNE